MKGAEGKEIDPMTLLHFMARYNLLFANIFNINFFKKKEGKLK